MVLQARPGPGIAIAQQDQCESMETWMRLGVQTAIGNSVPDWLLWRWVYIWIGWRRPQRRYPARCWRLQRRERLFLPGREGLDNSKGTSGIDTRLNCTTLSQINTGREWLKHRCNCGNPLGLWKEMWSFKCQFAFLQILTTNNLVPLPMVYRKLGCGPSLYGG